jgi:endoglucanase
MPTEEMRKAILSWSGVRLDRKRLEAHLKPALEFRDRTGRPLYCGEFGVIRNAPIESQKRWLADMRDMFDRHDIGWANWDYKGGFGLLTPEREERPIREALFPSSQRPR